MTYKIKSYIQLSDTCHWFLQAAWAALTCTTSVCLDLKRQWHIPLQWQAKVSILRTWWLPRNPVKSTRPNYTTHCCCLSVCLLALPEMGFRRYWLIKLGKQLKRVSCYDHYKKSTRFFLLYLHHRKVNSQLQIEIVRKKRQLLSSQGILF